MNKHLFLHIGLHKTGTTSIQHVLMSRRKELLKGGILYPKTGFLLRGQHNLAWSFVRPRDYKEELGNFNDLKNEISNFSGKNVVISSEDFCLFDNHQIKNLADLLSEYLVTIIVYFRRQDYLLHSLWIERAKFFGRVDFDNFYYSQIKEDNRLDFLELYERWSNNFKKNHPNANISVKLFDSEIKRGLVKSFLEECLLNKDSMTNILSNINVKINNPPGIKTFTIIHLLAEHFLPIMESWDFRLKVAVPLIKFGEINGWNQSKLNFLTEVHYLTAKDKFSESNKKLLNLLGFKDKSLLFDNFSSSSITKIDDSNVSKRDLILAFKYLFENNSILNSKENKR